jgi:uncharacterized membrane protein
MTQWLQSVLNMKRNDELNGLNSSKKIAFLSLFTSTGTIVCCALPAFFVAIGAGAALSSFISVFPEIVWISKYKNYVFLVATILIVVAGFLQYKARQLPCPADKLLAGQCMRARRVSAITYLVSVVILLIGFLFAYLIPYFM